MSIKVCLKTNREDFLNDYMDVIRAFYPYVEYEDNSNEIELISIEVCNLQIDVSLSCGLLDNFILNKSFSVDEMCTTIKYKANVKRFSKLCLYEFLSTLTNHILPYGSLTGIRPTKLFHESIESGIDAYEYFSNTLKVSPDKTKLIETIVNNQNGIYNHINNAVDIFVNIPVCLTRCSYCSFISAELKNVKKLITPYTDLLLREIEETKNFVKDKKLIVRSIYVGGGTPTSIDDYNFLRIVNALNIGCKEYTVEAGRPDTITKEKLDIMKNANVTRISINPQTFNQKTLDLIGRKHSIEDIYNVYELAKEYDFIVNMDLIAMLPGENFEDFKHSVDCTIALNPDNITVHTLALKRGSKLQEMSYDNIGSTIPAMMVDYAMEHITKNGYEPYYMYKQKHASGNLENVGYCKKGTACIYNIDIMEETNTIIANGAGAISKRINNTNNSLERLQNPKPLDLYIERDELILEKKKEFFSQLVL